MKSVIINMDAAEIAISILALVTGVLIGYIVAVIRRFLKDKKFDRDEKQISKQINRMSIWEIQALSEKGNIRIAPSIKTLIAKIDRELNNIEIHHRERSEIEDDIDELSGVLQQLANA